MQKQYKDKSRKQRPWSVIPGRVPTALDLTCAAKKAKCDDDPEIKSGIEVVFYTGNKFLAQCLWQEIERRRLALELSGDAFYPPIEAEQSRGELRLGIVKNAGCEFGLWLRELCQHVLVVGRSGAGKTTLIIRLLMELLWLTASVGLAVRILVFDIKRDYEHLPGLFPEVWKFRLPGEDFRWNPLEPPINDWQRWAGILASSLANSCGFIGGMATENLIYRCLLELYAKYDMDKGVYPCLLDLLDYLYLLKAIKKIERSSEEYKSFTRILSRIENYCYAFGEMISCSRGYPLATILGHHVVFDIAELKSDAQTFFTETLLVQVLWHRIERGERGGDLRTLAVFDEGKRLFPRFREESQHAICNMSHIVAMAREFGLGLIVSDCDPHLLGDSIKSSSYTRICFGQTHGRDIKDSMAMLNLDFEQMAEIQKLEIGEAIVRLAGRIKRPFAIEVMR